MHELNHFSRYIISDPLNCKVGIINPVLQMKTETSGSALAQAHKANMWGGCVTAKLWPPNYSSLSHWAVSKASPADREGPFTVANIKSRQKRMGKNPRMLSWLELFPRKQRSVIRSFYPQTHQHKNVQCHHTGGIMLFSF